MESSKYTKSVLEPGDVRLNRALLRVGKLKSFYSHLLAYLVFNTVFIVAFHGDKSAYEFWRFSTFSLAFFWGIGLVAQAVSVFGRNIFFTAKWEERKINELMENDKN